MWWESRAHPKRAGLRSGAGSSPDEPETSRKGPQFSAMKRLQDVIFRLLSGSNILWFRKSERHTRGGEEHTLGHTRQRVLWPELLEDSQLPHQWNPKSFALRSAKSWWRSPNWGHPDWKIEAPGNYLEPGPVTNTVPLCAEIKLPSSVASWKKQGESGKISTSASLTTLKPLTVWITANCGKFLKGWKYQTTLSAS